jgi:thiol-disulfide isomerase/thioredoxin
MESYANLRKIIPIVFVSIAGIIWIWFSKASIHQEAQESTYAPQVGFQSPSISLQTLNGDGFHLSDHAGQPLVINFWASWCPPCRAEMPDFQQAFGEYGDTDLVIAAINATNQDSPNDARTFIEGNNITFTIPLDPTGATSNLYNIHSLPTTFFINRDGKISRIIIGGPIPLPLLRSEIDKLIQ